MFEALATFAAAWRTIIHVSEWTGLSIGMLLGGAALIYLVPASRKLVILAAIAVVLVWLGLIHGDRVGRADVEEQWADARKAAIEADRDRDELNRLNLERIYQPQLIDLQKQADARKQRSETLERQIAALSKGKPASACLLGDRAIRVRRN